MGHGANAKEAAYLLLAERLNRNPVGTPINEELMEILHHLYTESEAMVGGKFPMAPHYCPVNYERTSVTI
ncbi:MAG TPA: hypothetical protein VI298_04745 [Geobacteraceae bacterium]